MLDPVSIYLLFPPKVWSCEYFIFSHYCLDHVCPFLAPDSPVGHSSGYFDVQEMSPQQRFGPPQTTFKGKNVKGSNSLGDVGCAPSQWLSFSFKTTYTQPIALAFRKILFCFIRNSTGSTGMNNNFAIINILLVGINCCLLLNWKWTIHQLY